MTNNEALRALYRQYLEGTITAEEYTLKKNQLESYIPPTPVEKQPSAKEEHIQALKNSKNKHVDAIKQLNSKLNKTNMFAIFNFALIIVLGFNVLQPENPNTITVPINPATAEVDPVIPEEVEIFTPEAPTFLEFPTIETENLTQSPQEYDAIMQEAYKSIFEIRCTYLPGTSYVGAGWAATVKTPEGENRTLIVTNHHVIEECLTGGVITASNQTHGEFLTQLYTAEGGYWEVQQMGATDSLRDLATLQPVTTAQISGFKFQPEPASLNQWVAAVGYPSAEETDLPVRTTTVGRITEFEGVSRMILTSAEVKPGNSGGPLLNNRGEIVGTVFANSSSREGVGFAQPLQYGCTIIFHCLDNKIQYEDNVAKIYTPLKQGDCLGYSIAGQYNLQNVSCDSFNVLYQIENITENPEQPCDGIQVGEIVAGTTYSFCAKKFE